jgi:xanthine dehydrogenase iron-sulfur cluster and FAD-binding subunit A
MRYFLVLVLLVPSSFALIGCVAGMAVGAAGFAARSAMGKPVSNQHLKPEAVSACTARASQYGAVHIIDVEQRGVSKMIVWGTADDGKQRRSFECGFGTRITGFKLRAINPSRDDPPAS